MATILIFLSKVKEINYIRYASYYCIKNINNKFSASDTFFWVYTVGDDYDIDIFLGETDADTCVGAYHQIAKRQKWVRSV